MPSVLKIKTDINHNLEFGEETIKIAEGMLQVISEGKAISSISVKEISNAFTEEGLGIAKLIIKTKSGEEKEVAYFTKNRVKSFRKFVDAINEYVTKNRAISKSFSEKVKIRKGNINTIYWLYGYTIKHRKLLVIGLLLSLLTVGFSLVPPYLLKVLIDNVILSKTHPEMLFEELTIILILSYAFSNIVNALQSYVLNIAGNRIVVDLRSKVFERAINLSPTAIDNISTSRIQTRLTSDTGNTQWLMTYGLNTAIIDALTITGIGVILFTLFPKLALYVLLPIPFIILLISGYNRRSDRAYHKGWRRGADMITKVYDVIPNYLTVKAATKEGAEKEKFNDTLGDYYKSQISITKIEIKYWQPVSFLVALATVIIWWVGGNQVIAGVSQLGIITAFLAYMGMFYSPIQQLSNIMPFLQESVTSGERIRELFDAEYTDKRPRERRKPKLNKDISIQDIWFGYDPLFPVVKGVSAKIKHGKKIAIVGKSGSGKSTLVKLLLGLYRLDKGDIKFGGVSINDIDPKYLRGRMAYVPQEASFFENSISYNIAYYSKHEPKPLDIIAASKAVEMHEEIMKFPIRYDNRLRGRGINLSGGQRQRLSIARAILSDSDIVLLDEITASLDAINARKVDKAIMMMEKGKTMVLIAHDVSEIMNSDLAIVLEDGSIVEQGRPRDLVKKKGKLYKMFKYRFGTDHGYNLAKKRRNLKSFVKDFVIRETFVEIGNGERKSLVNVRHNGKYLKNLIPKTPFPISCPEFVIFSNRKGKELFALEDYNRLDKHSKGILASTLERSNFNPKVTAIHEIKITGDGLEWKLETNKGKMRILTRNRQDIITEGNEIILIDEFNTPLKINIKNLDKKSIELLDKSI